MIVLLYDLQIPTQDSGQLLQVETWFSISVMVLFFLLSDKGFDKGGEYLVMSKITSTRRQSF